MRPILHGSTDQSTVVRIVDATDGSPETGVTTATGGLAFWYRRELGAKTAISGLSDLATLSTAHADGGLLHISDGYYRIDPPDAAWASGQQGVMIGGSATGMVVIGVYHPLVAYDGQNATSLGLSRLDAAMSSRAAETTVDTVEASLSTLTARIPDTLSLANINAEVDTALNTAIPGSPAADSINERIKAIDDKLPSGTIGDATSANQTTIINATDTVEAGLSTLTTRIPDTISLANINAEVDTALNTAIPGTPTANSVNERLVAIDDKLPSGNIGDATAANQTTILTAIQAKREVKGSYNINGSGDIKVTVWLEDYNGSIANCSACTLTLLDHDGTTVIASGAWTVTATENTGNNTWFASKTAVVGLAAGEVYQLNVTLTHSATPYTGIIEVNAVA